MTQTTALLESGENWSFKIDIVYEERNRSDREPARVLKSNFHTVRSNLFNCTEYAGLKTNADI